MKIYDAIVVGGGPGGGTAAYFLGAAGKQVLVLEKETLPRYKACGGGLSGRLLEEMFPFSFEPVIEAHVQSVGYALGGHSVSFPLPDQPISMVMRDRFDAYLLSQAQAEVCQGKAVQQVTELEDQVVVQTRDGETFAGRYLVGADGASSVVARAVGLRSGKTLAAAIEAEARASAEVMRRFAGAPLFIFGEIRNGYLWIFPKANHLSVGIAALHPRRGELQATLKRVIAGYGIALEGVPLRGHPLPIYLRREPVATARTLLVGDAAGLVDPFNGEGIRFAIKSGRLAAEAILADGVAGYSRRVFREIGMDHSFALGLGLLFYRFPRVCYALGVRNPFATRAFVDLLAEKAGYPEVLLRLFGSLPYFVAVEGAAALAGRMGGPDLRRAVRCKLLP